MSAQDPLQRSRDRLDTDVRNSDIGAGYAQMLNFFVDPSISASRLDADDGTRYDVFKLPLQYEFALDERDWRIAVRGTLSHAAAENEFSLAGFDDIDGTWEADSAQLGLGVILPAGEYFSWFLSGQFGISRLENDTDYGGPGAQAIFAPLLDGILFNWETNARILGLGVGLDYKRRFAEMYDARITTRFSYNQIESYSESRDLPSFREETGTLSVSADIDHPWSLSLGSLPLFGTVHLGASAFTGQNRNVLGFTHFYLAGYSVGLNVAETNRFFEAFSLGAHVNFGGDVDGYSLRFAWRLK
ncbi:MAG: hypothetical protein AAGI11_20600 [Pseudomonadota bacterium]